MTQTIINYTSLFGFLIFTIGIGFQMKKVWQRKSSGDIAIKEILLRILASIIVYLKFITTGDVYLIIGQGLFIVTLFSHLGVTVKYRHGPPPLSK